MTCTSWPSTTGSSPRWCAQLARRFRVTVVPATHERATTFAIATSRRRLSLERTGRPGRARRPGRRSLRDLVGHVPIFGICLGHQLLADGARRRDLQAALRSPRQQPSRSATSRPGRIEITAQNHNYAVAPDSLERAVVSHVNLNDGVIEGIESRRTSAASRSSTTPKRDPDPTTRATSSIASRHSSTPAHWRCSDAAAQRPRLDHGHRLGPDRHRSGL